MKTRTFFLMGAAAFALATIGCLPSLNPVYTESDLVFDDAVLGTWYETQSKAVWTFTRADDTGYIVDYTDDSGRRGVFRAHLAEFDGLRVLDMYPDINAEDEGTADFKRFHYMPFHTIYIVRQTSPTIMVDGVAPNWLEEQMNDPATALPHVTFAGRKVITAPTEEMQSFVSTYRDKFTLRLELTRERPQR
jgi:hypothetical protein